MELKSRKAFYQAGFPIFEVVHPQYTALVPKLGVVTLVELTEVLQGSCGEMGLFSQNVEYMLL